MQAKLLNDSPERTYALVFGREEEVMAQLEAFAKRSALTASRITGIGAFERATLGFFDWETKDYVRIPVDEQVEVLSLLGDIAMERDQPKVHLHVVLGKRDGSTVGGHLLEAHVRPTLEVLLTDAPAHLRRRCDPESGLTLIDLHASDR